MMRAIKLVRELLFQNLLWKVLSLLIAVVIWALVATEPELTTMAGVRLEYKNLPEGLEVASEPSANTVLLELSGPSGALRGMGEANQPAVVLDMSDATSGQHTFSIGDRNVKVPRGVRLVRSIPAAVRFQFEPWRVSRVPVRVRFLDEGRNGFTVAEYHVDPPELSIAGPRSHVARVAAVSADPIEVANLTGTSQFRSNVFTDDSFVRLVNLSEVVVTVTMKKK